MALQIFLFLDMLLNNLVFSLVAKSIKKAALMERLSGISHYFRGFLYAFTINE